MNSRRNVIDTFLTWWIPALYFFIIIAFYLRTYDSCQIKITILQFGATIAICAWLIRQLFVSNRTILPDNKILLAPLIAFLVSGIISFIISPFHGVSYAFFRRVFYVGLALIIMQQFTEEHRTRRLINFVIAGGVISCLYGLIQFIDMHFYPGPPEPGLDPFIWRMAFYSRVFSTMGNPGFWGNFLIVLGPIVLALILKTKNILYIILFFLVSFNLGCTLSKVSWIGYAASLAGFSILTSICYYQQTRKINKFFLGGAVILILLLFSLGIYYIKYRTDSVRFRVYTWLSTWEMIVKRPILGNGIGTFYIKYPLYRRPQIFFIEGRHNTETDHPESEFLEVLYDEGIIGFGIFLWLIITFVTVGGRALRTYATSPPTENITLAVQGKQPLFTDSRGYYLLGVLSSFIGVLIANLQSASLRFVSSGIFLGLFLGLIGALSLTNKTNLSEDQSANIQPKLFNINIFLLKLLCSAIIVISGLYLIFVFGRIFISDMEHNLAIFFSKRGQWDTALIHYNKVNRYDPYFVMSHYFMGNVFNDRLIMERSHHPEWGDRKVDKQTYEKMVKQYAHDIELGYREFRHNPVTDLYEEYRNDPQRAVDKYDDVKRIAPNYVQVHYQTGLLYMYLGNHARAQARTKGDMIRSTEYYQKSLENFGKYRAIDPIFARNYVRIAYVYLQLGDLKKAEQTYRDHINSHLICKQGPHNVLWEDWSLRRSGEYADSAVNLGELLFKQNKIKESEDWYKKAIELNPNSIQSWRNLAILCGRTQKTRDAFNAWSKVLQLNPNDYDAKRACRRTEK